MWCLFLNPVCLCRPSYFEGKLKLAEKERMRKEKAKGALQATAEPSEEELQEKDRIAAKNAEALLEELDNEQKVSCIFWSCVLRFSLSVVVLVST